LIFRRICAKRQIKWSSGSRWASPAKAQVISGTNSQTCRSEEQYFARIESKVRARCSACAEKFARGEVSYGGA
jgi:hypothetical protein